MLNTFLKIERTIKILSIIFLIGCSQVISASEDKSSKSKEPIPKEEIFTSKHEIKIGNSRIKYTATVGTMEMKDSEGKPIALFGYTAYIKDGGKKDNRPLLFAYNGGPGSASIWLHMGFITPPMYLYPFLLLVLAIPLPSSEFEFQIELSLMK